jgi:hypothetical protein
MQVEALFRKSALICPQITSAFLFKCQNVRNSPALLLISKRWVPVLNVLVPVYLLNLLDPTAKEIDQLPWGRKFGGGSKA